MEKEQTYGEWLRERRIYHRFTQDSLAAAAGNICTGAYISTLEKDTKTKKTKRPVRPDERIVEALAVAMGESVAKARHLAGYASNYKPEGTLPRESAEEALRRAHYFNGLGLSDADIAVVRPILVGIDEAIERLAEQRRDPYGIGPGYQGEMRQPTERGEDVEEEKRKRA